MTAFHFKSLHKLQQLRIVLKREAIAKRTDNLYRYLLYEIDCFFIEVKYSLTESSKIDLTAFETIDPIEPYLLEIDISNLIQPNQQTPY